MLVTSFLSWISAAPPRERAEAVQMLASAYLSGATGADRPADVEAALTMVLDDPAPLVRKALAMAFADRPEAPRHIILSLAADQSEVSALLVARSPLLATVDLVELAGQAEGYALLGIALRPVLDAEVATILVGRRRCEVDLALLTNRGAEIAEADLARMLDDFGGQARLREAMLRRPDLPAAIRHKIATILTRQLGQLAREGGFMSPARSQRMEEDAIQSAALVIVHAHGADLADFVAHLRHSAELTPGLVLRSLLCGRLDLLAASLVELTGLEPARVAGILHARSDAAIIALLRKAGFPVHLEPALIAAIRAAGRHGQPFEAALSRPVIQAVIAACARHCGGEGGKLMALLRRYDAEAARADSRRLTGNLRQQIAEEAFIAPLMIEMQPFDDAASDGEMPPQAAPWAPPEFLHPQDFSHPQDFPTRRHEAGAGTVQDVLPVSNAAGVPAPIPDLRSLIEDWKRERADRLAAEAGDWEVATAPRVSLEGEFASWKLRAA